MRNNGPVTGKEIELRENQLLISRTDPHGRIEYVNAEFAEISGFSEDELIGQPHNIVRHPDMPAAVFADLWSDLRAGRPWVGIIQNRCKNGDSYWVEAHVSPICEEDRIVAYLSTRRKARPEDIAAARVLYARLRHAPDGEIHFRHGAAPPRTPWARLRAAFASYPLAIKFMLALALACLLILGISTRQLAAHLKHELDQRAINELRHDVSLVRAAVSARVESANVAVVHHSKTLNERVYLAMGGRRHSSRDALEKLIAELPKDRENPIDAFMLDLDGVATVFVLTPDGFQRRLTTAVDENGNSATGTRMTDDHPALLALLAGHGFVGPARVFGRQYVTSYQPLLDNRGEVIGASVIGIDMAKQLDTLKSELRNIKIGETGYYYIVDATPGNNFGMAILHPYKESDKLLVTANPVARELINEMARNRRGEIRYLWRNEEAGEQLPREKVVTYDTIEQTNWIVAGGTAIEEFSALSSHIAMLVIGGGLVLTLVLFAIVLLLLQRLVLKPLNQVVLPTFQAISSGDYSTRINFSGNDEMARGIQGLENLRNRLAYDDDRERSLSRLREEARQEAEALSRARAEFLANMSHEIRTPLNAVIGLAYLLNQSKLQAREREYVRRIEGAGKLLLALINDVLDFSKIDAGRMQLDETDFQLDDVLDNLTNLVRSRLQEKNLLLEYVVAPNVPSTLRGDALRLSQILINLVGNAIKFTTEGAVTIFVDASAPIDGRIDVQFRVRDTGIGMTAEQQASLFRAFIQADSSITRKYGGTGLGLVICQRLVELMNGRIRVDSAPDIGSTFSFNVQLGVASDPGPAPEPYGFRVMVVDDNDLARFVLQRLLEKLGCHVETANSGAACLSRLDDPAQPAFDCLMLDLNMPEMDGLDLAARLRRRVPPGTRLVAVTAENAHSARYRHALDDFDALIEKPLTAAHLSEVLEQLRDPSRLTAPGAASPSLTTFLNGLHILVAEDVPTNQLIMRDLMEPLGAVVDIADNGEIVLQQLAERGAAFDMILMDIQMPVMDGLEATRRIRSGSVRADIPIIALTAHALEAEKQRAREAGMDDFLTKPIEPDQLLAVIQRWRKTQPMDAASAEAEAPRPSAATAPPPDIPGIDTADGLRRMMGRRPLYEKILGEFISRFDGETERIRTALADGDQQGAVRRAHSVKGTAGMIGAQQLSSLAADLELVLKEESSNPSEALQAFDAELQMVLAGIREAFPQA